MTRNQKFSPISVNSMLIIRLSAIGDIVMASGVIPALRRAYPRAEIDWLVQPECASLLQGGADLREVLLWPRQEWSARFRAGRWLDLLGQGKKLANRLRSKRYDLVLDLQGLFKSGFLAALAGGRKRIGLNSREGSRVFMSRVIKSPREDMLIASEYRAVMREIGVDPEPYSLGVIPSEADRRAAGALIRDQLPNSSGYALLCPFTTRKQKHWFEERWAELGRKIQDSTGLKPVILGGPGDIEPAERIRKLSDDEILNFTGRTTLRQSLALVQEAGLVVGVDTGLTHMGGMARVPTLTLFGATRPYLETGSERSRVLYEEFPCSPCRRNPVCSGEFPCMRAISVDMVVNSAGELLSSSSS